jgi:putative Holliday junction resolvase
MKLIGIDYGARDVGIALSDDTGAFAFPVSVLPNDASLVEQIATTTAQERVEGIVLGESRNFQGEENKIMGDIHRFKGMLESKLHLPVFLEPEYLTTAQAARHGGDKAMIDAAAAAIILQSFIDKKK